MKKRGCGIYIVIVFVICVLPFAGMSFAKTTGTVGNAELSSMPELVTDEGVNTEYLEQMGQYFEDHFAFRKELITANSFLRSKVFHSAGTEKVVTGQDGWLYYQASVNDYLGRNVMSDRAVFNAARNLALLQQYTEDQGSRFLFTIAPNKMSLYPEALPYYYQKVSEENNRKKLTAELERQGIHYVDLFQLFEERDEVLYLKRDSHWNNKGAVLAYNELMDAAQKSHETYENIPAEVREDYVGDLSDMLYPLGGEPEENIYYDKEPEYTYLNDAKSVEDSWIVTGNSDQTGRLLMYRDSFGNTLLPLLSNEFQTAFYSKLYPYPIETNIETSKPHLVIVERVERHLTDLAGQPPIMEGPQIQEVPEAKSVDTDTSVYLKETENYYVLYGRLDERYTQEESRILVRLINSQGEEKTYEASPMSLTIEGTYTDYGYQLYLRKDSLKSTELRGEVLIQNADQLLSVKEITEKIQP